MRPYLESIVIIQTQEIKIYKIELFKMFVFVNNGTCASVFCILKIVDREIYFLFFLTFVLFMCSFEGIRLLIVKIINKIK